MLHKLSYLTGNKWVDDLPPTNRMQWQQESVEFAVFLIKVLIGSS